MRRHDGGNGLDLKDHLPRDNDVSPEPLPDRHRLIDDRNANLPLERYARLAQFMTQALLVHRLEQTRPGMAMHLNRQPDNLFGQYPRQ